MQNYSPKEIFKLPKLKLAVIGHIEWVSFVKVDTFFSFKTSIIDLQLYFFAPLRR